MHQGARADNLTICYHRKQIDVSFYTSVLLLLTMNYITTLPQYCSLQIHLALVSQIQNYFDNAVQFLCVCTLSCGIVCYEDVHDQ